MQGVAELSTWVTIKEAWKIATEEGVYVALNTFQGWVRRQEHGIVRGEFGGRTVVRRDTIPKVITR